MIVDPLHQCKPLCKPESGLIARCDTCGQWWADRSAERVYYYPPEWFAVSEKEARKAIRRHGRNAVRDAGNGVAERWS